MAQLPNSTRRTINALDLVVELAWGDDDEYRVYDPDLPSFTLCWLYHDDDGQWVVADECGNLIVAHQIARSLDCGASVWFNGEEHSQVEVYERAAQQHVAHMQALDAFEAEHNTEADPFKEVEQCPWCGTLTQNWNAHTCYGTQGEAWHAARSDDR